MKKNSQTRLPEPAGRSGERFDTVYTRIRDSVYSVTERRKE